MQDIPEFAYPGWPNRGASEASSALAPDANTLAFIRALPKTETHLHIEGALPFSLLRQHYEERFPKAPASWEHDFRFRSFAHFEDELLSMAMAWHKSAERYYESAKLIFARHLEQNVKYVETSFASGVVEFNDVPGEEILEAIHAAVPPGLEVRVFMGIHHNGYTERMRPILDGCVQWEKLAGLDLHGVEETPLEDWTPRLWEAAQEAGKVVKAHAGEFCGPDFVRRVVNELGVRRVQHGTRVVEDPDTVRFCADRGVTFDMCPISNVKLGVVDSLAAHPIRHLLDEGLCCTVSTDDPISFGNSLHGEYAALAGGLGFDLPGLAEVAANGFRVADLPDAKRDWWISEILQMSRDAE